MKLTKAERRVLNELHVRSWSEQTSREEMCLRRDLEVQMLNKGLISRRAFAKSCIAATQAGRSAFSNGESK